MGKLYFQDSDSEMCYSLDYFIDLMIFENWEEMELHEAIREVGTYYFWCKIYGAAEKDGMTCDNHCKHYKPRNGKSGICKEWAYCYTRGNKITLTKKGIIKSK